MHIIKPAAEFAKKFVVFLLSMEMFWKIYFFFLFFFNPVDLSIC